jgi:probable HAF family extracellular repeat protein
MQPARTAFALALIVPLALSSDPPSFTGVGDFSGGLRRSSAQGVSGDGKVVCGFGTTEDGLLAFRWTAAGGLQSLGELAGGATESVASGISADGSVIVGNSQSGGGLEGFRWTAAGGMTGLGDLPGGNTASNATRPSADGSVVAGYSFSAASQSNSEAFAWTAAGGLQPLGDLPGGSYSSWAAAVSADGTRIACTSNFGTPPFPGHDQAALWTPSLGLTGIGMLPGTTSSTAVDISADGRVIVGDCNGSNHFTPFRWDDPAFGGAGLTNLGPMPGGELYGFARAASADGSVIGGQISSSTAPNEPFVWTASTGAVKLGDLLTSLGLDLTGWKLQVLLDISDDGRTLVGYGLNPLGDQEGWVAFLGDAWTALDGGLSGTLGVPTLAAHGALVAGFPFDVALAQARPSGIATLVGGFSALNVPFKGGTMVPSFDVHVFGLPLDGTGALSLASTWPVGTPSGFSLWLQAWIADPVAVQGFAASNAVVGVVP